MTKNLYYVVNEFGVKWDANDMNCNSTTGFSKGISSNPGECGINLTLIPHDKYKRHCNDSKITLTMVVAHCRGAHGRSSEKATWMVEANLWEGEIPVEIDQKSKI